MPHENRSAKWINVIGEITVLFAFIGVAGFLDDSDNEWLSIVIQIVVVVGAVFCILIAVVAAIKEACCNREKEKVQDLTAVAPIAPFAAAKPFSPRKDQINDSEETFVNDRSIDFQTIGDQGLESEQDVVDGIDDEIKEAAINKYEETGSYYAAAKFVKHQISQVVTWVRHSKKASLE